MKPETIGAISAAGALLLAFVTALLGYHQGRKKEHTQDGEYKGVLASDIGYIKSGVDDMKREQKETNRAIATLNERLTRVEESTKQAHKRINDLKGASK
ncbi:MAG: hypothetical protein LIO46_04255 [Clostridiales bacterium]|nr:hypothetical protein [Clostridiales bacterium]